MKNFITSAVLFILFSIAVGFLLSETTVEEGLKSRTENCPEAEKKIQKQLIASNYCRSDSECKLVSFGCPWDKNGCYTAIHKNHSIAQLRSQTQWFGVCRSKPEFKAAFETCEVLKKTAPCPGNIREVALKCVDRKCVVAE